MNWSDRFTRTQLLKPVPCHAGYIFHLNLSRLLDAFSLSFFGHISSHVRASCVLQSRDEVCQLLCLLTKDNLSATLELNELITGRVRLALSSAMSSAGVAAAVRHEMALLAAAVQKEDSCWEHRLRSDTVATDSQSRVDREGSAYQGGGVASCSSQMREESPPA